MTEKEWMLENEIKVWRNQNEYLLKRVAELEADRRNLLDEDLKAAVCVQLQRELNDAKDELVAARALLKNLAWITPEGSVARKRIDAALAGEKNNGL